MLTQFIIPRQRNTLNGSLNPSKRSTVAVSRLSAKKRYACNKPDGPINLSGFHQNEGHALEQHAQRIHSYRPSNLRSEEHTSELQSRPHLVCRLLLEKKKKNLNYKKKI